jgi:hypothetical protein
MALDLALTHRHVEFIDRGTTEGDSPVLVANGVLIDGYDFTPYFPEHSYRNPDLSPVLAWQVTNGGHGELIVELILSDEVVIVTETESGRGREDVAVRVPGGPALPILVPQLPYGQDCAVVPVMLVTEGGRPPRGPDVFSGFRVRMFAASVNFRAEKPATQAPSPA